MPAYAAITIGRRGSSASAEATMLSPASPSPESPTSTASTLPAHDRLGDLCGAALRRRVDRDRMARPRRSRCAPRRGDRLLRTPRSAAAAARRPRTRPRPRPRAAARLRRRPAGSTAPSSSSSSPDSDAARTSAGARAPAAAAAGRTRGRRRVRTGCRPNVGSRSGARGRLRCASPSSTTVLFARGGGGGARRLPRRRRHPRCGMSPAFVIRSSSAASAASARSSGISSATLLVAPAAPGPRPARLRATHLLRPTLSRRHSSLPRARQQLERVAGRYLRGIADAASPRLGDIA